MRFFASAAALIASAALASANSVTFLSTDTLGRTLFFTPNSPELGELAPVRCEPGSNVRVDFPYGWQGNFYAVQDGQANEPGMLGEFSFDSWQGFTCFDVSAIVKPQDTNNIARIWPVEDTSVNSGCKPFPCNNAYYLPDDTQTKVTPHKDFYCTLGQGDVGIGF